MNNYCVITTINKPTKAIEALYEKFGKNLTIVGDKKTPDNWHYRDCCYMSRAIEFPYAPFNHYARKNMGYLEAMSKGADLIYDTDDDNIPNSEWGLRFKETKACPSLQEGWHNVYENFTIHQAWPRGFPLSKVNKFGHMFGEKKSVISSIQQGVSDGEADVDAIYRLTNGRKIEFKYDRSIYLDKNTWCPFNSQSTWWFPDAYPLMYLPVNCSFRMTDIWRSFIAQRCLWEINQGVTFHSPSEVYQERNEHDLMKDFEQEVQGYLNNEKIVNILGRLKLFGNSSTMDNMQMCYQMLCLEGFFPEEEMKSVIAWRQDYEAIRTI